MNRDLQKIEEERKILVEISSNDQRFLAAVDSRMLEKKEGGSASKTEKSSFETFSKLQVHFYQILSALKEVVQKSSAQKIYESEVERSGGISGNIINSAETLVRDIESVQMAIDRGSSKLPDPKRVEGFSEKIRDLFVKFCGHLENYDDLAQLFAKEEYSRKLEEVKALDKEIREKSIEMEGIQEKIRNVR